MKVALSISHGRMAPCFAGVELWLIQANAITKTGEPADLTDAEILSTHGWHPLVWGRELMRHDVGLLLCAGMAAGTWAAIQGHGIEVIPNAMGDVGTVLAAWRDGHLSPSRSWPAYPGGFDDLVFRGCGGGRRRRRFQGGKGIQ